MHFVQGIVGFFPTVNNMEMLKIAISQTVCAAAHQGDRRMPPRGFLRSQRRESAFERRGRRQGLADSGLPHPEPEDAAALREGGAAGAGRGGGSLLSSSRGWRVTWARDAAAIGPRHVSMRPARDVTRGGSVKNKNKIQSESVSGCAKWPGNFRAGAEVSAARARRRRGSAGIPARPGPAQPLLLTHAARAAGLGGTRRGRGRTQVGRPGPQRGGGRAQRGPAGLHVRAGSGGRADRRRPAPSRAGPGARARAAGRRRRPEQARAGVSAEERAACMRAAPARGGHCGSAGSAGGRGSRTRRGARSPEAPRVPAGPL